MIPKLEQIQLEIEQLSDVLPTLERRLRESRRDSERHFWDDQIRGVIIRRAALQQLREIQLGVL